MVIGRKLSRIACHTEESIKVTSTEKELRMKTSRQKPIASCWIIGEFWI
jgi:hypothetical protein